MPKPKWTFEVIRAGQTKFWTRIKAQNGQIVWTSEVYTRKANAVRPMMRLARDIGINRIEVCQINNPKEKR